VSSEGSSWRERVRSTWDERAPGWDSMSEANARSADRAADMDRLMAALQLAPGSRLLDAGCGTGQFAIAFAQRGCRVTGIDLAPSMIERARENAQAAAAGIELRTGDFALLDDGPASYDAIYARAVLQFVEDIPAVFDEFRRVLTPGGRLFVSVPGALSPIYQGSWRRHVDPEHFAVNFMVPWELEELLAHCGWTVIDQWGDTKPAGSGNVNPHDARAFGLHSKRLQQAIATTWAFVAAHNQQPSTFN
jgi:SAM-dependent methyltransferase